ncbi:MAG: phenylalanine--tRNA ligase subunit alpha, partial [Gemmatimonadales bacterium]
MTLDEFVKAVSALDTRAASMISSATTAAELEAARNALLGRKNGQLSSLMKSLPTLAAEDRREAGAAVNRVKTSIEELLSTRANSLGPAAPAGSHVDLTMPARHSWKGGRHPVT